MAHLEAKLPSQQNILFFLFYKSLVPLADEISAEPTPKAFKWRASFLFRGTTHSENLYSIHKNTAFANCGS